MIYDPKLRKNKVIGYFIVLTARSTEGHLLFTRLWNLRPEHAAGPQCTQQWTFVISAVSAKDTTSEKYKLV